jgi:hypothetical protein
MSSDIHVVVPSQQTVVPLVVRPKQAWAMLGCSHDTGYKLLERGELETYLDGGARKITGVASIKAYIARQLKHSRGKARKSPRKRHSTT